MSDQKIAIVTDSSADLPKNLAESLNIHIIPLWIHWGEEKMQDGIDIPPKEFYKRLREADELPTTSQPSAGEFIEFYKRIAEDCDGIVSIHVSSKLSGTVGSASAAANQFTDIPVRVLDSLSVTMGLGFVVLAAAEAASQGQTFEQVISAAEAVIQRMQLLFVVDTLENLHKGGRITGAKALLGTALSIKPLLQFEDGLIQPLAQVRTKKKAIAKMLDEAETRLGGRRITVAAVVDCDSPTEADAIAVSVKERFGLDEVTRALISPAVGIHGGPGTVGLVFYTMD